MIRPAGLLLVVPHPQSMKKERKKKVGHLKKQNA